MALGKAKTGKKKTAQKTLATAKNYSVLLKPVVTEKSSHVGNGGNTIVFKIDPRATKDEVKEAIESIYGKQVDSVRVANYRGKPKQRMSTTGRSAAYKKAYVTLKGNETVDIVEGV